VLKLENDNMAYSNHYWRFILTLFPVIGVAITAIFALAQPQQQSDVAPSPNRTADKGNSTERAILAGGCFWGMEDLFRKQPGVVSTRVGYSGGNVKNATYRNHGTHAEAIEVVYDPSKTSFRNLLEFFFQIHDPTTKNRQGNDRGTAYRSAIFFTSEEQRRVALDTIEDVDASGLWPAKVVTEVEPASEFWEAEAEHQDYLVKNPRGYTCHFPRKGWVLPKRTRTNE
jgi:peptide-methionine (S)-S-oxide reductase